MAGVASLFTREFFAAARARLAPGGIICQWAHTYDIAEQDLRSIAATFATAFPNGTMWAGRRRRSPVHRVERGFRPSARQHRPRVATPRSGGRPGEDVGLRPVQRAEPALTRLAEAASASERLADARRLLEALASRSHGRTEPQIALARLLAAIGEFEQATARAQEVIAAEPGSPRGPELLASILADSGDVARLGPLVARMRQAHPDREETSYYAAMLSFLTGNFPRRSHAPSGSSRRIGITRSP